MRFIQCKVMLTCLLIAPYLFGAAYEGGWETSSGDYSSTRLSKLDQINIDNIEDLDVEWIFNTQEFNKEASIQSSPIFTGKYLITVGIYGSIFALDPKNGKEVWRAKVPSPAGRRGITFSRQHNLILVPTGKGVSILDADFGKLVKQIQCGPSLLQPILGENKVFIATLKDGVKAYDLESGKALWHNDLLKGNVQPRVWSGFSYDIESKIIFVNTANPGGLYGGKRLEDDLSNSLIALDSRSGEIKWHYQHIIHDLWDLDLVGNPMIIKNQLLKTSAVLSLSKTGEIIYLDVNTGEPVFKNSITKIPVPASDVPGEITSKFQKEILLPQRVSGVLVDLENDFSHLDQENRAYVDSKLKYAKSGIFLPPSLNYDLLIYGLHGGPQWMGAALSARQDAIVIPFNKDPWLLRLKYQDSRFTKIKIYAVKFRKLLDLVKAYYLHTVNYVASSIAEVFDINFEVPSENFQDNIDETNIDLRWANFQKEETIANVVYGMLPDTDNGEVYTKQCSSCHGIARQGNYENEYEGDYYAPPLVGITLSNKGDAMLHHETLRAIHNESSGGFDVTKTELSNLYEKFTEIDNTLLSKGVLEIDYSWQMLLDKNGYPASKPPWGGIAKVNLSSGNLEWSVPFGTRKNKNGDVIAVGDKSFGGVLSTKSGLVFATGTPDEMARAYRIDNGEEIWAKKMPYAGSAPPMSFEYKGCQYIVFIASGGQFVGFEKNGDAVLAYKLGSCASQ